jgi:hypothetical protein
MKKAVVAAVLASGALIALWFAPTVFRNPFHAKYSQIKFGMSLQDVEEILGHGDVLDKEKVPKTPDFSKPKDNRLVAVVNGDQFYIWHDRQKYSNIILGFVDGRVFDKRFWEPSL